MSTDILNLDLSFKHEKNNVGSNKKVFNFQKINTKRIYLPWVEKYRPNKLDNIILDSITKTKIVNFIQKNEISNMIMTGHPGTGKTSTIKCLAKDIFKEDYKECRIGQKN